MITGFSVKTKLDSKIELKFGELLDEELARRDMSQVDRFDVQNSYLLEEMHDILVLVHSSSPADKLTKDRYPKPEKLLEDQTRQEVIIKQILRQLAEETPTESMANPQNTVREKIVDGLRKLVSQNEPYDLDLKKHLTSVIDRMQYGEL